MEKYNIDVLDVAECRNAGSDRVSLEDKTVFSSGIEDGKHYKRVVLFCSKEATGCLLSWEPIN